MAGENKVIGSVSFTPIVKIAADLDADAVDAIHHNIKGDLGGDLTFTSADADDKWFYAPNVIVENTTEELFAPGNDDTDLVGASGDQVDGPNEGIGAELTYTDDSLVDASADKIRFLFIRNTGTSDIYGTTTTNSVYFTIDNSSTHQYNQSDSIEVAAGEAFMSRLNGVYPQYIHIQSGLPRAAGTAANVNGSVNVRCTVSAIIEDVVA